ncbi:lactococcin 972 family bacteriocin [Curtobacterium aurantiacum]|uniref:lactococcin 972 family bacteriocin n=1 Tax=Curtobacterium aurantiacum TaxID=3236919 RepID=UPI001BE02A61|nr:lactococcin 972 family bacteriocin [Curtobacterium flaccumfaciens]MBT1675948.1 lactococcin 972 family bacteriocin [Curtobacterium flaccumfaciens pv. flaccumfaciens]
MAVEEHGAPIPGGGAITPSYTITPEGGGSWSYGTNGANNTAYSNFYHKTRKHGSSVENGAGNLSRSRDTAGGATAKSSIRKTYAGNHAYYRFVR